MMSDYALVGDEINEADRPTVFELRIYDHIPLLEPADFGIPEDAPRLDPLEYFITSGDAISKTKYLCKMAWQKYRDVKEYLKTKPKGQRKAYEKLAKEITGKCQSLMYKLINCRGESHFLETEWRGDAVIVVIAKNPRPRDNSLGV